MHFSYSPAQIIAVVDAQPSLARGWRERAEEGVGERGDDGRRQHGADHSLDECFRALPPARRRGHAVFTSLTSFPSEAFASPNSMLVAGAWKSMFSIPAKPAAMPRLRTITVLALSTSRIGIP